MTTSHSLPIIQGGNLITNLVEMEKELVQQTKISLPILPNIEENGVEWGKDKMNIIQFLASCHDTMNSQGMGEPLGNLLSGTGSCALMDQPGLKQPIIAT